MRKVILDTSFILACVEKKIDFFEKLVHEGYQIIIPEQVIDELMGLGSQLSLNILEKNKFELAKIPGRDADSAIIALTKTNKEVIVATLDRGLQKKIKNRKIVIRGTRRIELV